MISKLIKASKGKIVSNSETPEPTGKVAQNAPKNTENETPQNALKEKSQDAGDKTDTEDEEDGTQSKGEFWAPIVDLGSQLQEIPSASSTKIITLATSTANSPKENEDANIPSISKMLNPVLDDTTHGTDATNSSKFGRTSSENYGTIVITPPPKHSEYDSHPVVTRSRSPSTNTSPNSQKNKGSSPNKYQTNRSISFFGCAICGSFEYNPKNWNNQDSNHVDGGSKANIPGNTAHLFVECDMCHKKYHMGCLNPPMLVKPKFGYVWHCKECDSGASTSTDEEAEHNMEKEKEQGEKQVEEGGETLPRTRSKTSSLPPKKFFHENFYLFSD